MRLKHPLHLRDQDRPDEEGQRSNYTLTKLPLPRGAPHHTERSPLSLWFLQWEKRTKRGKPVSPSPVGCFTGACTLVSHHGDCSGICRAQCWKSDRDGEEGWAGHNWHTHLVRPSSSLQRSSLDPNQQLCSSSESNWGCTLIMEFGGVQTCLIGIRRGALPALQPGVPMPGQGAES